MRFKPILRVLAVFLLTTSFAYTSNVYAGFFVPYASHNRINTEDLAPGTVVFQGELTFDSVFHKLGKNWITRPDALGLNKYHNYMPSLNLDNKWEDTYGQTLLLNVGVKPIEWFFAEVGIEMIGDYADRYWIPVNQEHRMSINGDTFPRIDWNNAKIGINLDWISLTYYKNYLHLGWKYEGDMFDMLTAQDNPDDYLRYSGHHSPDYWQLKTVGIFGDLDVMYGEEVMQDYKQGIYVKYKNIFGSNINFYYSDHLIPYGKEDERMRNFQLNTDFNITKDANLQIGALYRPFRLDTAYQYVEKVESRAGIYGSKYVVKNDETKQTDALGGSIKLALQNKLWMNYINVGYEYRGLVAGNRHKVNASVEKQLGKTFNAYLGYYYQKPLLDAMPLLYSGGGAGPIAISGRDSQSPFWVWWRNPITGFDNRETSSFSLVLTHDPTPATWFYLYEPNNPQAYNLNPDEDAPFSFVVKANVTKYFGTLDRQTYWEYDGSTVWEDIYSNGTNAPDRYIGSLYFLGQFIKKKTQILYDFEVGEDLTTLSYAYPEVKGGSGRDPNTKPIISYFKTSLSVKTAPYLFKVAYYKDFWGPEDWHRNFGATFDEMYLAHISRDFGTWFNAGVEYAGARKTEQTVLDAIADDAAIMNETGYFDEIRVFVKVFFGATLKFASKASELPFEVEYDKTPPQVALKTSPDTITQDQGQRVTLEPWVTDHSGVDRWNLEIKNSDGNIVKTFSGTNEPPEELSWNGKSDDRVTLPEGIYYASLEAYDNYGNYAASNQREIRILNPPKIQNTDIKETERGLVISLGAKVLFDTGKYNLKSGATKTLKEVAALLNMYPDNDISIEGHTDWVGKVNFNQKLSEQRATSVKNFLIKQGVAADRMKVVGYGKLRPVADNNTAAGREQNRRVEIVVLNNNIVVEDQKD